ncbi:MAG: bifunctional phosphopantothenoylcysteine decarboxylase/phosphopantothenate--cysteine ligase CoaBC [Candidatus Hodarchaeales archaeon]|jgi:phosphopantothenoylcysteine decarboxylase/phosphopantothenate--cysteine ligase
MGIHEIFGTKGTQLQHMRILIGVTGSIAAIEIPHLIREILRYSGDPVVVLSQEATRFVAEDALTWCMDKPPITQISGISEHIKWISDPNYKIDLFLICPATANTISKLANGIADGPVTLAALAAIGAKAPVLIVPAAHSVLLVNPIIEKNMSFLAEQSVSFLSIPEEEDKHKFPPLEFLMQRIFEILRLQGKLRGKKFLITGGATREYLDDVRFLSNPSTGLSAFHVAMGLKKLGGEISIVLGEGHRLNLRSIPTTTKVVRSTKDMYEAVNEELLDSDYDGLISVAAVSDYKPRYQSGKIASKQENLSIALVPTRKIIQNVRKDFPDLFIVAYKAEVGISQEELINRGTEFLEKHKLDMVCANWVGESEKGFDTPTNEVYVIRANKSELHLQGSKKTIGFRLAEIIAEEIDDRSNLS